MPSTKSRQSRSTTSDRTAPSCDMAVEMSLISSSCIIANSRVHCSSPSAIMKMAAFCGPASARKSSDLSTLAVLLPHPAADDRQRPLRVLLHEFADPPQRGGAHLSLDLGDVHHAFVLEQTLRRRCD